MIRINIRASDPKQTPVIDSMLRPGIL